jgi:hypothetical protein
VTLRPSGLALALQRDYGDAIIVRDHLRDAIRGNDKRVDFSSLN